MTREQRRAEVERKREMGKATAERLSAEVNTGLPVSRNPDTTTQANLQAVEALPERARENGANPERVKQLEGMVAKLAAIVERMQDRESVPAPTLATASEESRRIVAANPRLQCPECGQYTEVCRGEHVTLIIQSPSEDVRNFSGVTLNGRRYVGRCIVAKCQVDTIRNYVNLQACAERDLGRNCGVQYNVATIDDNGRMRDYNAPFKN